MSYRVFNAYVYDKTDDELIEELNSIRKDYIEFAKKAVKKDPKWFIDFGDHMYKRWAKRGDRLLDKAIRVIEKGMYDMQRGNPADFSGDCVVVRHQKKIVLWFFPGYRFDDFMKQNEIIKRLKKNDFSYMDGADCEFDSKQEEKDWNKRGKFWDSVFDKYKTSIASNIGLTYEFFRHDDIWDVAYDLYQEYEKTVKKEKKKGTK
jgi:hypothetical protein